jgi:hypothetical protein
VAAQSRAVTVRAVLKEYFNDRCQYSHLSDICVDDLKVDFLNIFKIIETAAQLRGIYESTTTATVVAAMITAAICGLKVLIGELYAA